jgi:hypothetical protein
MNKGQSTLLDSGYKRHAAIEALHTEGRAAASALRGLIGQRCFKMGTWYEITDIYYGWDGCIKARGYRIVKGGKRGTRSSWEIGVITSTNFPEATDE